MLSPILLITSLLLTLTTAIPTPEHPPSPLPLEIISSRTLSPSCPKNGNLPPVYIAPSLMVPVSARLPNVAFGPTKSPLITPNDFCTIFNLVIPPTAVAKTCTLLFLFPSLLDAGGPFVYSGKGHFTFTGYAIGSGATAKTTYVLYFHSFFFWVEFCEEGKR